MNKLTAEDLNYLARYELTPKKVEEQINRITRGIPYTRLHRAAIPGDGIFTLTDDEKNQLVKIYEESLDNLDVKRFVPASGAATRMFQELYAFLENPSLYSAAVQEFFDNKKKFPFYKKLKTKIKKHHSDYQLLNRNEKDVLLVKTLLGKKGLNYGELPKALIEFHKSETKSVTAFEEQLFEAAQFTGNKVCVHFTVSEKYLKKLQKKLSKILPRVEKTTRKHFEVSFSFQPKNTDSIALDNRNELVRDNDDFPLLRPSGHGALIGNLNRIDADIIFIKNIDNVVVSRKLGETVVYKKILAGKLLQVQKQIFEFLKTLENVDAKTDVLNSISDFIKQYFNPNWNGQSVDDFKRFLNRPLRICGMVKNTGQPGGGPFWVENANGNISLQIVELAQINQEDETQAEVIQKATHFNPVDLVCGVRNYRGEKFDLMKFVDAESGFIIQKSYEGKQIKSLELPGLWNGSMAGWLTLFVEVPLSTFNPVKSVNDLLLENHQYKG